MRTAPALVALGAVAVSALTTTHEAQACGGCFVPPAETQSGSVITDERMIFRVTPQASTLYDEIRYAGNPQTFAWVLPIHGTVSVGLSSDIVFAAMDAVTSPTIISPPQPQCPSCSCSAAASGFSGSNGGGSGSGSGGGVNVLGQATVGPYETVQLQSTDSHALDNWLTANGYAIPADIAPVLAAYVSEGFDFLALKLSPGQGVSSMRPVRVTSSGASLSLPLRMVAAGTGATVGVTLWVVGDGRYEPQNFKSFIISPDELVWDWSTQQSNYAAVRAGKEATLDNAAWQIESALQLLPYAIENAVLAGSASDNYLPVPATGGGAEGGAGQSAEEVQQQDLATLFPGGNQGSVWVTRMRSDLARAALASDLVLQAAADQSALSNDYPVTRSINAPACPPVPASCCGAGGGSPSGGPFGIGEEAAATNGRGSGCSTSPDERGGGTGVLVLAGLAGATVLLKRGRRRGA